MVLASRWPRTVVGRLVACHDPVRPAGLSAGWLPEASWGGGLPWCGPRHRGDPESRLGWPCRLRRGGAGPCRAASGSVPEPASPGHQRCRVVPGRLRVMLPQWAEPVQGPPPGGIRGIYHDHLQPRLGGHLHEPVPELSSRDARDRPPEGLTPSAARGSAAVSLAALGASLGEVQVLDHNGPRAVLRGGGDEGADGGP